MPTDAARLAKEAAFRVVPFLIVSAAFSITLYEIFAAVLWTLCLFSVFASRDFRAWKGLFGLLALAWLAAVCLSLVHTEYLRESLRGVSKVARGLLLCFSVAYALDTEAKLKTAYRWFLATATLMSLDAIAQANLGFDPILGRKMIPYYLDTRRVTGPFKHANDFSAYLSMMVCLFAGILPASKRFFRPAERILYSAGFLVAATCLLWTYSRAGWLAVSGAIVLWAILRGHKPTLIVLACALVWAFFFSPPLVRGRLQSLADFSGGTLAERRDLWGEAGRMVKASPVTGLGVNTYARNEPKFKLEGSKTDMQYAHNGYLQMAAETGLLGVGAFLVFMAAGLIQSAARFVRKDSFAAWAGCAFAAAAAAFLLHALADTNLHSVLLLGSFWTVLGCLRASALIAEGAA